MNLDIHVLLRLHDAALEGDGPAWPGGAVWEAIADNHHCNRLLWDEEDLARRTTVPAAAIAAGKRLIDRYNQQRNDAVEAIDEALLATLAPAGPGARQHSETAGAMIDRLSILALKISHMHEQTRRTDVAAHHVAACLARLARLQSQRTDLATCLASLLADAAEGRAYFKVYRQYKMYNDPALNPYLRVEQARPAP